MIFIILIISIILLYFALNKTRLAKYNKNNYMFCVLIFVIFTVVQGFRAFEVGTDTSKYVEYYYIVENASWIDVIKRDAVNFEIGFVLIMKILSTLHLNARFFLIVVAIIINGGLAYFVYKNSKNPLLSILIFMGAEFFNLSFTALRQMIAIIFILNTYTFIKENKIKESIIMIILASLFHTTALIFMPVLLFKYIKVNKKTLIIILLLFFFIQLLGEQWLQAIISQTSYSKYLTSNTVGGGKMQLLVISAYTIIGICIYYKNDKTGIDSTLILIMIVAIFIQSFACRIQLFGRMMWYFYIFNMIYLPNLIKSIEQPQKRYFFNIAIGGLSIAQYVLFSMKMYNVQPYIFLN